MVIKTRYLIRKLFKQSSTLILYPKNQNLAENLNVGNEEVRFLQKYQNTIHKDEQ